MKSLVAYYSRTNITKKLAEEIAGKLNADVEEIKPKVNYQGKLGYARGGKHAIQEKIIDLEPLNYDPKDYDMVYLGAPVWAGKSANPLISYIKQNEGKFENVKFFVTAGSSGFDSTFAQLEEKVGIKPQKTLALTTKEVKKNEFDLSSFLQ
ncbi:MAG: flavodoxin [Methanobrevibacter sp.]|uniref:flavodoxin family protein n=1 Tax=Methanobrevibacter sp. TaxID=66852 RepID=UPI0025E364CA|nr:flavodoxin [Methanobrevibacter sp.]MBQ6100214.1 flavodoxin [Methanobrevibacter sp.]